MRVYGRDVSMIRGDTEAIRVSVKEQYGDQILLGDGDTIYFTIKEHSRSEVNLVQKVVNEFVEGEAIIKIDPADTKDLEFKTYYYDIQLTRANGDVKTIIPASKFKIESEITYE